VIAILRPGRPVGFRQRGSVTIVNAYANAWPILFPQHGAGRAPDGPEPRPVGIGPSRSP